MFYTRGFKSILPQKISMEVHFWFLQRYMPASGSVKPFAGIISFLSQLLGSPDWTWTSDTLINSQVLLPTELRRNIETQQVFDLLCLFRCRRLSIFPDSCPSSIVDASELNYCVRNGNRWTLTAIGTDCMRENSQNWITNIEETRHKSLRFKPSTD